MAKINTKPLSGMRDFLPLDVLRRNYVIRIIEEVYQGYGFEPLETPVMERLDTLLGKYGEEGDQLIFRIMKRGDKLQRALDNAPTENSVSDAGMRYDLTVPMARVVAQYRNELPRYFKRYQIQPVYRADRPAKGRYREFYQCDVDVVGSASRTVEAEVIAAASQVLQRLGFDATEAFSIRLNHRGVLRGLMEVVGVPPEQEATVLVAIDKMDKIGLDGVRTELADRGVADAAADQLMDILSDAPNGTDNAESLAWLGDVVEASEAGSTGVAELKEVVHYSSAGPAAQHLRIDPYLARGLSYYTGSIFEIALEGYSGSSGAGGRYNDLVGMFSGQQLPSCGFSLGLERIILVLDEKGMFPERLAGQPQVLVTQFDESTVVNSLALAQQLRGAGIRVDLYPDTDRYGRQFQYAESRGIRYAALVSPNEVAQGVVAMKDLVSGDQVDVAAGGVIAWLEERI